MSSFKSRPLSSLLLIGLLAWIAIVLIAPQIDLEDAAFQSKDSPLAIHALTHRVPHGNASVSTPGIKLQATAPSNLSPEVLIGSAVHVPSAPPRILRC
jgi:hypothetical protein